MSWFMILSHLSGCCEEGKVYEGRRSLFEGVCIDPEPSTVLGTEEVAGNCGSAFPRWEWISSFPTSPRWSLWALLTRDLAVTVLFILLPPDCGILKVRDLVWPFSVFPRPLDPALAQLRAEVDNSPRMNGYRRFSCSCYKWDFHFGGL